MNRPLRIEYPGAWYHVMNRGRRVEEIFTEANDYRLFLDLRQESSELWNVKITAYCLMPRHYHLLIQTPEGNLSRCMRHINGVYTQRFNRAHHCDGQLFRGRFKSILVDGDSYLLQLVRYIHRNPLRAGLVEKLNKYPWSSHKGYLSKSKKWDWLNKEFILTMLSADKGNRRRTYGRFVSMADSTDIVEIFEGHRLPSLLGGEEFIIWVKETFFTQKEHKEVPESMALSPDLHRIKDIVCEFYGVDRDNLHTSKRGVFNEPRAVAIYLARMLRKDGLDAICREFSMNRYSSASSVIERVKRLMSKNKKLKMRIDHIRLQIHKGQTKT